MPTLNLGKVKGDKGDAATINIVAPTTLPAGSQATVTNTGNANAATFLFGIPQGIQGEIGPVGPIGPSIESLIINEVTASRTLAISDVNQYIRCTNVSQTTITIPLESSVAWPSGAVIYFRRSASAGSILLVGVTGVTITGDPTQSILENQNFAIKKVGTNTWDVI